MSNFGMNDMLKANAYGIQPNQFAESISKLPENGKILFLPKERRNAVLQQKKADLKFFAFLIQVSKVQKKADKLANDGGAKLIIALEY
jgi:hypothetical protein